MMGESQGADWCAATILVSASLHCFRVSGRDSDTGGPTNEANQIKAHPSLHPLACVFMASLSDRAYISRGDWGAGGAAFPERRSIFGAC